MRATKTPSVKFLVVGAGLWPWYEQACQNALIATGHEVQRISYAEYFYKRHNNTAELLYRSPLAGVQNRLLVGPLLWKLNAEIVRRVSQFRPDVVWFFNCTHVFSSTVRAIRRQHPFTTLVQYANDNPFTYGTHVRPDYYRHFKRSIPFHDLHFVYRRSNINDFKAFGVSSVYLLRSYFIPEEDYRTSLERADIAYQGDIVFAGHYEADGRLRDLEALAGLNLRLNLFGPEWQRGMKSLAAESPLRGMFPVRRALGEDYRKAISGAKIALCFLSKINADTYTRRNFQIPAMGVFMLSEYSDDLASLFTEGVDAEYFRTTDELVDKARYYLKHEDIRNQIARRGLERVWKDGHDVKSRMKQFAQQVLNGEIG